jgi:hypothetical protein
MNVHEEIHSRWTKSFSVHVWWCKLKGSNTVSTIHLRVEDAAIKCHTRSEVLDLRDLLKFHYDTVLDWAKESLHLQQCSQKSN